MTNTEMLDALSAVENHLLDLSDAECPDSPRGRLIGIHIDRCLIAVMAARRQGQEIERAGVLDGRAAA